jgi:iron complex transport system ATP-binding protein
MISCKDLKFSYNDAVIFESLSFDLQDSTFAAIIGPNGAGKTTLLKLITGLHLPDQGSVNFRPTINLSFAGKKRDRSFSAQDVMWLPSRFEMPFEYTISDVMEMLLFPWPKLLNFQSKRLAITSALQEVGLTCNRERPFNSLSAGEQHRAMIGAAIVSDAKLLLLDEPCANLDIGASHRILQKLRDLNSRGKSILFSIHDLPLAYQYCDNFLLLAQGKDFLVGNRDNIFSSKLLQQAFGVKPEFVTVGLQTIPIFHPYI